MRGLALLLIAALLFLSAAACAAEGTLKLKFTLKGTPPAPKVLAAANPCGAPGPVLDRSLLLGPKGEIQNIVVYLYLPTGTKAPECDAALKALAKEVQVDNKACYFEPRVSAMHISQTLILGNPDPVGHSVKGDLFSNASFSELIPATSNLKKNFPKGEKRPLPLSCAIHPFMGAYILISDNPFFGVSDATGAVTIPHIPGGKHTFSIWHEKAGFLTQAKQGAKDIVWKQGRIDVTIDGNQDLGEFQIPVELFKK